MLDPASPVPGEGDPAVRDLHLVAREIEPGDHLPPQRALHGTRYQHDGFTVGDDRRDVLNGMAVLPQRMLLFGPGGTLDAVTPDTLVTVRRRRRHAGPGHAQDGKEA